MRCRVLVTGASGFLGNHLVRVLIQNNYNVRIFIRETSDISILGDLDLEVHRGDFSSREDVGKAVENCTYVIHCASLTAQDITDFEVYQKANIDSTRMLVEVSKKHPVKRFIYVSSTNSFTPGSKDSPGNENSSLMKKLKNSGYAYSKYLAQTLVLEEAKKNDFPGIVVAPAFMVGPCDPKPSSGALLLYAFRNKILFCPRGGKSFVDVKGVATATVNALVKGETGESYILSGINLTYKEFFKKVAAHTAEKKVIIPVPKLTGNILSTLSFLIPLKKLKHLRTNVGMLLLDNYFDNSKARTTLSMPQTKIDSLVAETVEWFLDNNYMDKKQ